MPFSFLDMYERAKARFTVAAGAPHGEVTTDYPRLTPDSARDEDLAKLDGHERFYFELAMPSCAGEDGVCNRDASLDILMKAFTQAGFDPWRPKLVVGDTGIGHSWSLGQTPATGIMYAFPHEAQSMRMQGYTIHPQDPQPPAPRVTGVTLAVDGRTVARAPAADAPSAPRAAPKLQ